MHNNLCARGRLWLREGRYTRIGFGNQESNGMRSPILTNLNYRLITLPRCFQCRLLQVCSLQDRRVLSHSGYAVPVRRPWIVSRGLF